MNKALIFDLDGTLVLTEKYHAQAFSAALAPYSIPYSYKEHLAKYTGRGNQEILTLKLKEAGQPLSLLPKLSEAKKLAYNLLIDRLGVPLVEGAEKFLKEAHSKKLILAIATSTTKANAETLMEKTGFGKYFKAIISREDVERTKPCPDIFIAAAREIKEKPEETVVLEDSPRGIEAASRGGFATVALTTTSTRKALLAKGADLVVKDFSKIALKTILRLTNQNRKGQAQSAC